MSKKLKKSKKWVDAYVHIAKYAAPMVLKLWQNCQSYPADYANVQEWRDDLHIIYLALKEVADDKVCVHSPFVKKGLELFGKRFVHLWD